MGRVRRIHVEKCNAYRILAGGRNNSVDLNVVLGIILKWIFKK
jgi:hypothetical protein